MDEEQEYIYGQGLRKDFIEGAKDLGSGAIDYAKENPGQTSAAGVTGLSLLGNLIYNKGIKNYMPGQFFNSPMEKQFVKRGAANLSNPKYLKFLGQAGGKVAASRGFIPATAALVATDVVKAKEGEALAEMRDIDAYQRDQEQAGIDRAQDIAMTMRKYNIIEEQRAAQENRLPYGYDPDFPEEGANINVTNFRDYLAQVPKDYRGPEELDFSLIDLSGQSQFPYYKDQSLNTGIDFSKFEQGEQPVTQPNLSAIQTEQPNLLTSINPNFQPEVDDQVPESRPRSPLEIHTEYLGNLEKQGVSADERAEIASRMLAPFLRGAGDESRTDFERASAEREARIGAPKIGLGIETPDNPTGDLTLRDYKNIVKAQGVKGSAQTALAKQMMQEAGAKKSAAELNLDRIRAQIEKAKRPAAQRAPTSLEIQSATINQLVPIQQKLEAGIPISPEEEVLYRQGSTLINLQQNVSEYGGDPIFKDLSSYSDYQQEDPSDAKVLPSATDPEGEELIAQVMSRNPGKSREDVIAKLISAKKLSK